MSCTEKAATQDLSGSNPLDRLLMIGAGERPRLIYFVLVFFLLGAGMAIGRGTTDALFYKRYGIEYLPVMYLVLSLSLMMTSTIYAAFSDMLSAERFFKLIIPTLILLLIGNWALMSFTTFRLAFPIYFLVYEIASEVLLVHSMLYLSQNLDTRQIKRLSPLILAGMQVGVICGGLFLATSSESIGVQNMLLVWGGLLSAAIASISLYHRQSGVSPLYHPGKRTQYPVRHALAQIYQGARFARQSRLLRNLSIALFFMVIAFYVLCYTVGRIYTETFADEAALAAFFGMLTVTCGSLALLLQIFVTNRVIRSLGTKRANLIFPLAMGTGYAALLLSFTIPFAVFASILKDALMPAFRNPVRNLFFNALPGYMQGRSRAMALVLVMPLALSATGVLLLIAQRADEPLNFLMIGVASALCYIYFSIRSNRSYLDSMLATLREKIFLPGRADLEDLSKGDATVSDELVKGIQHPDDEVFVAYARTMLRIAPDQAIAPVFKRIKTASMHSVEQLVPELSSAHPDGLRELLEEKFQQCNSHCPHTVLSALIELGADHPELDQHIESAIRSDVPQQRAAGIYGFLLRGSNEDQANAWKIWRDMAGSMKDEEIIAALDVLERLPAAIARSGVRELPGFSKLFGHGNPQVRLRAIKILPLLRGDERQRIAEIALEDDHPDVRLAAAEIRFRSSNETRREAFKWIMDSRISPRAQESILRCVIGECDSRSLLQSLVRTKADDARRLLLAQGRLRGQRADSRRPGAVDLVCLILHEKHEQLIRLALLALEHLEDPATVATIRAGLLSGDRSHMANAGEALRYIADRELGTLLSDLLETPEHEMIARSSGTLRSTLTWCSERADPWLKSASLHALKDVPAHV